MTPSTQTAAKNSLFGDFPPKKVYFQVIRVDRSGEQTVTAPSRTFPEALIEADKIAREIHENNEGSQVLEIEEAELNDDFHIYVVGKDEKEIARIGVMILDVRGETMH